MKWRCRPKDLHLWHVANILDQIKYNKFSCAVFPTNFPPGMYKYQFSIMFTASHLRGPLGVWRAVSNPLLSRPCENIWPSSTLAMDCECTNTRLYYPQQLSPDVSLRPPRGSVKLLPTNLTNLVPLEQFHHKPMVMYDVKGTKARPRNFQGGAGTLL